MDKIVSYEVINLAIRSLEFVSEYTPANESGLLHEVVVGGEAINTTESKTDLGRIMLEMNRKSVYDISKHQVMEYFNPAAYVGGYVFEDDSDYGPLEGYAAFQHWYENISGYRANSLDPVLLEILAGFTELARAILSEETNFKDYSFPFQLSSW